MNPPTEVLRIPAALVEQLDAEARRSYPREACGFLMGERSGREASAHHVVPAENRARRPDRFLVDARDVFGAMRAARETGRELLGVYHSHPHGSPEPSATDESDAWYEWLYLIVSAKRSTPADPETPETPATPVTPATPATAATPRGGPDIACWRWDGERFMEVSVHPADEAQESTR